MMLLHGHHNGLITVGREYEERKAQILHDKPETEHELRLARMRVLTDEEVAALPPLRAEGYRLRAESERLRAKGYRLWDESKRLWDESYRTERDLMVAWHAKVCVPECKATPENNWSIFG